MEKIKNMKTEKIKIPQIKIKCKCKICEYESKTRVEIKKHLHTTHKIKMNKTFNKYNRISE